MAQFAYSAAVRTYMALSSDRAREAYKTAWNVALFLAWCCIVISIKTWEAAIQTVRFGRWCKQLYITHGQEQVEAIAAPAVKWIKAIALMVHHSL